MKRTKPPETKLVICVWHPFTWWRPQPVLAETIRSRWQEMKVVHLPDYDQLSEELPDTDIFVGYSLRAKQLKDAKKLKWIHSTAAGVAQLMYPELREAGILVTNPSGEFSVLRAPAGQGGLVAARIVGQAATFGGSECAASVNRGLRVDRPGAGETR